MMFPSSAPITYSVNGKQYVAVVVGHGGPQAGNWPLLVPEIQISPNPGGRDLGIRVARQGPVKIERPSVGANSVWLV